MSGTAGSPHRAPRRMWLGRAARSRHQLSLEYGIDGIRCETALWYEDVDLDALEARHGRAFMDRWSFHVLVLEASRLVSLRPDVLDLGGHESHFTTAFASMWRTVLRHVWAQWRYQHDDPDYLGPAVLTPPRGTDPEPVSIAPGPVEVLSFCGGGKDSLVGARLLARAGEAFATFGYSHSVYGRAAPQHALIDRLVERLSGTRHHRLRVFDTAAEVSWSSLYPDVREVVAAETPCSVFAALPVLLAHGYRSMVLAHERSANTGNLVWSRTGEDVNHQWGKSFAAERLLNAYVQRELVADARYFSVLQPVHDAVIFSLLRQDEDLFGLTHSCNVAKPWCGRCPKCAYVWLQAMAYLDARTVPARLGGPMADNLLDVPELLPTFEAMLGLGEHTPFECIGQVEEVRLAFALCRAKGLGGRAMDGFTARFPTLDTDAIVARFFDVDLGQTGLPEDLARRLAPWIEAGAEEGRAYLAAVLAHANPS